MNMNPPKILKIPVAAVVLIASVAWILLKAAFTVLSLLGGRAEERDDAQQIHAPNRTTDADNKYRMSGFGD